MKRIVTKLVAVAVVFTGGIAVTQDAVAQDAVAQDRAQEPAPTFEQMKPSGPFLGNWRYEGPLQEDYPGLAKKDDIIIFDFSWRRILNKAAVEETWSFEFKGGKKLTGKAMIGWDAQSKRLIYGGLNSEGGMEVGNVEFDVAAKTSTLTSRVLSEKGTEYFKGVVT